MKAFEKFLGIVAPLNHADINTDAIIPKQFMKSIKRTGFGSDLFYEWRYINEKTSSSDNSLLKNFDFVLNKKPYDKAEILLTGENFGCGSSREHAVWALRDFGFKAIVAKSYGEIFYSNAIKNGLLAIQLKTKEIDELFKIEKLSGNLILSIDLESQCIELKDEKKYFFEIDTGFKNRLLKGLDDIEIILQLADKIKSYEKNRSKITPWLFKKE